MIVAPAAALTIAIKRCRNQEIFSAGLDAQATEKNAREAARTSPSGKIKEAQPALHFNHNPSLKFVGQACLDKKRAKTISSVVVTKGCVARLKRFDANGLQGRLT
jgi:hypothetical protein